MAEPGEELLEGDLGDGEYNELDADEEEALLADDNGYAGYNLPSVTTHRDVYISTSPDPKASRKIKVEDVEDVAEGDEILDNEDVLELGVEGNWNIDDLDSESQDQNRNSERKSSLFQMWIKQERNDSSEFSRNNEPEEVEEEQELNIPSDNSNRKTAFITSSADISQSHLHDDDDEDDHERRDRFTSERSMPGIVSLKSPDTKWGAIPDSLDSVITANTPRGPAQKSPRGGGGGGIGRGGHTTPGRRGGRGGLRPLPPPAQDSASHHKVLINPHFKGSTPAPSHFPQPHSGNNYRDAQQHYDQPGYHYQKQPEYQQYQPQYPPHSHPQYQEPPAYAHNAPRGQGPHPTSGQGPHYQDDWQNPVGGPQQQYQQHNYPGGYYEEAPAPPPNTWNSPGQPTYQDYNQRAPPPHPHPHHQSPHRPPHHQQPPHLPHHPGHPMRPPAPQSIHQIVSQQQPPPPGLEAEFQPRKVQFSNENKLITVQMYSESAAGDVRQSPAQMAPPRSQPPPDQYLNQPPGPFVHQGGPPRPFFPPPQHHQPYRPPGSFGPPDHQQPPQMFPPSPQNHSPRFSPRFKGGGFQRGGFSPQFRPRMMQPGPSPPNVYNPRLPGYHQHQPIKRAHPEPQVPHQPPFKQKRPNPNCPEGHPNNKTPPRTNKQRNLLEVQTVDNVPDTTTFSDQGVEEEFDEDDDEETREYKRKIAEQKRLREKLLQEKEERRKLAAAAKQKELEERKVASQNVPNSQAESNPHNPAYSESSQPTVDASEGNRISVHQRIGVKPSPVNSHISPGSTQVTVFNQQQPTAFKIVRVRTKDGTVLIKKMPLNSAGQMMIQRPAHMPAPQHVVHHQPLPARQILQQMDPPPYQHQHHYQHPHPHPPAPQHQHIYPQQAVPLPPPPPQPPQEHNEYFQAQPNPPYQQPQPQPVQQPFYQQPTHQAPHPPPPQPPQIIHHHNPVPVVNSKRIVLDRPQTTSFKPNFQNRSRVRPVKSNASSNNSSVITIVPVNKNMTLGQRFTMQNQQVKKEQNKSQQEQKLPVQAQPGTKPNRTVINSVLNAGAPTIKIPLPPGPVTSKVVVDNLTAGTSRQQLVSMAEQVGEVKILTLDTSQKRASITFNNTKAATAFYQKFQRKMVNLSMINVSFVSE